MGYQRLQFHSPSDTGNIVIQRFFNFITEFLSVRIGCHVQVLAVGAAGACVRRGRGCPVPDTGGSGQIRLVPASSATAPAQGTAQPISNAGGTSVETSSERAKWRTAERSEGKSVRNSPESTKVSGGEGQEVLQAPWQTFPCSVWRDTLEREGVP